MAAALNSFFHTAADGGRRLYLHHAPAGGASPRGAIVYVHPWAEEMNKSRRMAALAARALAVDGWSVLQPDLLGCGDSGGDFGDASWQAWVGDVVAAAQWQRREYPGLPLVLWGLRTGALLCSAAAAVETDAHLLFWQPVLQGRQVLQQFLRLKAAARLADGGGKAILDAARADLAAGRPVAVAGYALAPALAQGLESAQLLPPAPAAGRQLAWIEVGGGAPEPTLSPASQAMLQRWQAAGWQTHVQAVAGPPFWQTVEIEVAPALIGATRDALATLPLAEAAAGAVA